MAFEQIQIPNNAPKMNHLGLLTSADGEVLALEPGCVMLWFVEKNKPMPYVLLSVDTAKLVFKCACKDKNCTKKYIWKMTHSSGVHR